MIPQRRTMLLCATLGVLLSSCASLPAPAKRAALLRLSPASLGGTLALQQQLTVSTRGQQHRFDVLLEADADAVRLAVLSLGQTVARLEWDGIQLTQSQAAWWPTAVSGERVLSDLQLMLWPAAVVVAALPPGWHLDTPTPGQRILRDGDETVATVSTLGPAVSELVQLREGYSIRVESRPIGMKG